MADGYSWSETRGGGSYRLPGPEHLGWWAAVAMLVSILMHIAVFLMLDRMKIALRFEQARELSTANVNISRVEVRPMEVESVAPPENVITPPEDLAALLDEVDLLDALPQNSEIDIKPDVQNPEYALQMESPALTGDPTAIAMEISDGLEIDAEMPELGRQPESLEPAAIGQLTVDPGAMQMDDSDLTKMTDELIQQGAGGTADHGTMDGITSLDDLLDVPPNVLVASKTMLPSDLLFSFNSAELRESAKVGLMKLVTLIDRNPGLYCWIEGHTDLVGGDAFNLNLSIQRAEAVKTYLVESFRMDASRIITRGFGRFQPLVTTGSVEEQEVNRRVEIRMRKEPPADDQMSIQPQKAAIIEETPPPAPAMPQVVNPAPVENAPPRAVLVKPKRVWPEAQPPAAALRAVPIEEPPAPRALPIEESPPPRANPVAE